MIEVQNVTKYYGNFKALDNISFSVSKGEIMGLLGPNGAGKTTAMRILTCFLPANSGKATVAGFDVFEDSIEVRRRIGYLPETPPLYPEMTVKSYLEFIASIREVPARKQKEQIEKVANRTGLSDHLNRIIGTLSKGYRQRVGLAQALIHDPEVLILDEPTVGLDPNQIIEIRSLIRNLSQDHTIILSTHILPEVSMTCKKVVIIHEGKIVAEDTVENLEKKGTETEKYKITLKPSKLDWKSTFSKLDSINIYNEIVEGDFVKFELRLPNTLPFDKFFNHVVSEGHIFYEITPIRASLEEVFIKLTKSEENVH